jgi:hypothetical protein
MSTPPLLLAMALVFWGQQTGMLLLAVPMALLLEGSRLTAWRSPLSPGQFHRISDLCTVLFAVLVAYAYSTRAPAAAIMAIIQWTPLSYLPLLAAQVYSVEGKVDIGALFMSRRKPMEEPRPAFDLTYPYFVMCVLSAGAANVRTPVFYAGMFLLAAWSLWRARPARRPVFVWAALLLMAGTLGHFGQYGLHDLQSIVENKGGWLLFGSGEKPTDPNSSHTAIGRIGLLKQSDEIILNVQPAPGAPPPPLLRQAAFDHYNAAQWFASVADFRPLDPLPGSTGWAISTMTRSAGAASISTYLDKGKGILPLPTGATQIGRLPAAAVTRNRLGSVQVQDGPGFADYDVRFAPSPVSDAPPGRIDLDLPPAEKPMLTKLSSQLKLDAKHPQEAKAAVSRFFDGGFHYSLYQEAGKAGARPLADFLLKTRSGHCEYFATATVLLLRAGGIPARYVTGYSVQEPSRLGRSFIVRQRHGHAWALVYADGVWRDFDTTPSSWAGEEAKGASFFEPARDLISWGLFRFSRWRWRESQAGDVPRRYQGLLAFILLGLMWKLMRELGAGGKLTRKSPAEPKRRLPGEDSELYALERALATAELGRRSDEPLSGWLDRLVAPVGKGAVEALRPIVALHNRYRFDPAGLSGEERRELKRAAESWLTKHSPRSA